MTVTKRDSVDVVSREMKEIQRRTFGEIVSTKRTRGSVSFVVEVRVGRLDETKTSLVKREWCASQSRVNKGGERDDWFLFEKLPGPTRQVIT